MTEVTYTLAEAERELRRRECRTQGHAWDFMPRELAREEPRGIICTRCGWTGAITMDEKP